MIVAKRGDWVQVHNTVLTSDGRAPQVPEDTKRVPLDMWVKGFLNTEDGEIGTEVEIITVTGRAVKGTLVNILPVYPHTFGEPQPELLRVGLELRSLLRGETVEKG